MENATVSNEITRRFELSARSAWHLDHRLALLLDALRARGGSILEIDWSPGASGDVSRASVVYTLPPLAVCA